MNNFYYENQGQYTYLTVEMTSDDIIDNVGVEMLTRNSIPGIAAAVFSQIDDKQYIKYNVTGKLPLSEYLVNNNKKEPFLKIMRSIANTVGSLEEYMLDPTSVVLDGNYIFIEVGSNEVAMIYLPIEGTNFANDFCDFFRNMVFNSKFDLGEDNSYIANLINYLNNSVGFTLDGFKSLIDSISSKTLKAKEDKKTILPPPIIKPLPKPASGAVTILQTHSIEKVDIHEEKKPPFEAPKAEVRKESVKKASEKQISWFYLMQHYNKENAALYKAQKEKKKSGNNNKASKKKSTNKDKATRSNIANVGFDIPGQSSAQPVQSFAPSIQQSIPRAPKPQNVIAGSAVQSPAQHTYGVPYAQANQPFTASSADFGDTVFAGADDDETTRFDDRSSQPSAISPTLIRKRNNERIRIDSPVFRIGRDSGFNNYAVTDNRYVGHTHCHIVSRGGEFFLVDDNSKNHTYLDGQQIPPSTEIKISHGQKFRLSDEEFEFLLY